MFVSLIYYPKNNLSNFESERCIGLSNEPRSEEGGKLNYFSIKAPPRSRISYRVRPSQKHKRLHTIVRASFIFYDIVVSIALLSRSYRLNQRSLSNDYTSSVTRAI